MEETIENYGLGKKDANVKILKKRSNNCNQCDYESSSTGHMRIHLKTHSGEKPNKCNQCDYASIQTHALTVHMKKHTKAI